MSPQTISHPRSLEADQQSASKPVVTAPNRRRRGRLVERAAGVVAIAAIIGGGVLFVRATDDEHPNYRIARATTQTVSSALTGVATVEPVDQAAVGFPTAGTVSTVDVSLGDTVTIGQQLATLDTLELERDLRDKQAALAQSQLVLAVALDGDDPSSVTAQSSGQTPMGFASTAVAADTATGSDVDPEIAAAQQSVIGAQQASSVALAAAAAALDSAIAICGTVATATDPTAAVAACQTALTAVTSAQQDVAAAQDAVTAAANALDTLLAEWATELESTPTPTTPTTEPAQPATTEPTTPTANTPSTGETTTGETPGGVDPTVDITGGVGRTGGSGAPAGGGLSTVTNTPSSQDLIAYQFDVDAAQFDVQAAEQALAQAVIVSPFSGTVTAIDLTAGDTVTAASSTQTIVVEGPDGYEATTTVSINDIADIRLTQKATVIPDGGAEPIDGKVVAIAPTPDPAASTTTYRVTIGFTDPASATSAGLRNGNLGTVSIITGIATDATSVPTSAITLDGTQHLVAVIGADGFASSTPVTIGLVGDEWTEITNGVNAGDTIAIADLDEPLPGSATDDDTNTRTVGSFQPGGNFQLSDTRPTFDNSTSGPGG